MKSILKIAFPVVLLLALASITQSCRDRVFEEMTYMANVPVYMEFDQFRAAVKKSSSRELVSPGKIYFKDNILYINESLEGVHIIDNSNPASPQKIGFIEIPGNVDIAIRGNILYADSFIDLVAIDISNPDQPAEVDRIKNAFPNVLPPLDFSIPVYGLDFTKGVVIGWEEKEVTEVVERGTGYRGDKLYFDAIGRPQIGSGGNEVSLPGSSSGIGGSMARFTIIESFMYAVHNNSLKVFNIGSTPGMQKGTDIQVPRVIETIYPFQGRLFLGTTTGMLVYGLNDPARPAFISEFNHVNSCDPVVVADTIAYVTLRSGTECNGFTNQLDLINISNLSNPQLIKTYPMHNPHGLGIDNGLLFICDGDAGLKVFDASNPYQITQNQIAHFQNIKTFDVIPYNGILMLIGADGLFQYDYTDPSNLVLLSSILVQKP